MSPIKTSAAHEVIRKLEENSDYLSENWSLPKEAAKFLYILIRSSECQRLLEVGTSVGYSGLHLGLAACENGGALDTIDASPERQNQAIQNFKEAGLSETITPLSGDACAVLGQLADAGKRYDFIFLDAQKAQYIEYFRYAERLLTEGGLLLADNTRSHRSEMGDFIDAITQSPAWDCADMDTPNGFILARKK